MRLKVKNAVIPCAGNGERLGAVCGHKCLTSINGKPVLSYIVDYWKEDCAEFIVIVPEEHTPVREAMDNMNVPYRMVVQEKPDGIANAVLRAENYVQGNLLVVLGDCLFSGDFLLDKNTFPGIGIWQKPDEGAVSLNYGALIKGNTVVSVEEKPTHVQDYQCGMGIYFFHEDVFDVIKHMPSPDGKKEITPLLSQYIKHVSTLNPVYFKGKYFNVNTEHDLRLAKAYYENNA